MKNSTVYIINFSGCPMLCQSKLQTETTLSTMEAEIIALAHCCSELFSIIDMTNLLGEEVGILLVNTKINISIYENNAGSLLLEETLPPQFTPRSKHYA